MYIQLANDYEASMRQCDLLVEVMDANGLRLQELFFTRADLVAMLGLFDDKEVA